MAPPPANGRASCSGTGARPVCRTTSTPRSASTTRSNWWNPTDVGKGKILFNDGTGRFCYPDDAKRFYASQWGKTAPKLFDMSNSICQFNALPETDIPPTYECKGCPSTKA